MTVPFRIGTRGSQLALWQARTVAAEIARTGGPACELVIIKTTGDRLSEANLSEAGGKRLFVKEIEDALLDGRVDLAVHSSKDMPAVLPDGLSVAGVLPREDPRDALVLPQPAGITTGGMALDDRSDEPLGEIVEPRTLGRALREPPLVGTSSVRRVAQLANAVPGARFAAIRGNVDTRLRKLDQGHFAAIVLAAAGLTRLGLGRRISALLSPALCVPAPGQGIVAIEARSGDRRVRDVVSRFCDAPAFAALTAERAVVEALGGGCQLPIGALAWAADRDLYLRAIVASLDGARIVRADGRGSGGTPDALGRLVAGRLLDAGAGPLLDEARASGQA